MWIPFVLNAQGIQPHLTGLLSMYKVHRPSLVTVTTSASNKVRTCPPLYSYSGEDIYCRALSGGSLRFVAGGHQDSAPRHMYSRANSFSQAVNLACARP